MTELPPDRRAAFRTAIERFLQERRDGKLEKLAPDDPVKTGVPLSANRCDLRGLPLFAGPARRASCGNCTLTPVLPCRRRWSDRRGVVIAV